VAHRVHGGGGAAVTLRCEQEGRVLTVFAEDPPHTYMTDRMQAEFVRLVAAVEADDSVGAVVVTGGVPGRYITHYDIGDLAASAATSPRMPPPVATALARGTAFLTRVGAGGLLAKGPLAGLQRLTAFQQALVGILRSPATWMAAVDGPCGGGGLEMSVFFDLRYASRAARFQLPEFGIGLTTTFGGTRLAQLIGPARATEMLLEVRAFDVDEAAASGLVDHVVDGDVLAAAQARAERYARRPRAVVAAQKALLNRPDEAAAALVRETAAQLVGLPDAAPLLRRWLRRQDPSGESAFLTDPDPWVLGTA
jgi:enoyl-CoA hydratase